MGRRMLPSQRLLLASIHDVSPRFESEVDQLIDLLGPHAGDRLALLVVPNHWGDSPIVSGSRFAGRLRRWADRGFEIFLHGYFHRDTTRHSGFTRKARARWLTAGEGEFLGLSRRESSTRIRRGRRLLEDVTGRPIAGFVAPAWLYGEGALKALSDCSIAIAEDHWRVWSPATGAVYSRSPVITWASRTPMRLRSSLATAAALRRAPFPILRIGVHPPDCRSELLRRSIEQTFRIAISGRRAAAYSDLAPSG